MKAFLVDRADAIGDKPVPGSAVHHGRTLQVVSLAKNPADQRFHASLL